VNWTSNGVAVSTDNPLTVALAQDTALVANFVPLYSFTASSGDAALGSVTTDSASGRSYEPNTSITLTAAPAEKAKFVNWTSNGVAVSTDNPLTVALSQDTVLVANFVPLYSFTASSSDAALGSVTAAPQSGSYEPNTSITLTAVPAEKAKFVNWTSNGVAVSTDNPLTVALSQDTALVANFIPLYSFTASSNNGALGSVTSAPQNGSYEPNTSITITATPAEKAKFVNWTSNGVEVSTDNPLTVALSQDTALVGNFERVFSDVATLSNLTVNAGKLSPEFHPDTLSYTVSVGNTFDSIMLTATKTDADATVAGDGRKALTVGENTFTVVVTAENTLNNLTYTVKVIRRAPSVSSNATLSSLTVSVGELSPEFHPDALTYTVSVGNDATSITLTATQADEEATVGGAGTKSLQVGTNIFAITVTAGNGAELIYTVTVTRAASSDATLSNLAVSVGELSPAFSSGVLSYAVSVDNATEAITLTATPAHSSATVAGDGAKALAVGENTFGVVVTAEDDTTELTYTVTVTRAAAVVSPPVIAPSSTATLSSLTVSVGTLSPVFNSEILSYTVSVGNATAAITLTAAPAHDSATVAGDGEKALTVGENVFAIVVTAEDDSTELTYTVTVTRESATAVGTLALGSLTIYPNPVTNGTLTIEHGDLKAGDKVEVYALSGALAATCEVSVGAKTTINISHLPKGAYIVKLGKRAAKVVLN
jgi:hypothetical protein